MQQHTEHTIWRLRLFAGQLRGRIHPEREPVTLQMAGPVGRISYEAAQRLDYGPVSLPVVLKPLWSTFWFKVEGTIPKRWAGRRVDLLWNSHSEATVWDRGEPYQGLNDRGPEGHVVRPIRPDVKVAAKAKGGARVSYEIEVACNNLFGVRWKEHVQPSPFVLEQAELAVFDEEAWNFYHDFITPLSLLVFSHEDTKRLDPWSGHILEVLNDVCNRARSDRPETWPAARAALKELATFKPASYTHELSAIGHAHIDTAWLWPLAETRRKCVRTFTNALNAMRDYPEYRFACSQAVQYAWMKESYPQLYSRIQAAVKRGQWVPVGGTWVEPDCNIPSGESLVRQFLYGQRFFKKEFGAPCREFWNPDVFGYSGALPQIMKGAGIDYFLTQKLSWNQFNKPRHHVFLWEGIDGTRILTHFPPADTYNAMTGEWALRDVWKSERDFRDHDRANESMILFGHGDGGGGPTRHMLEVLRRVKEAQGWPRVEQRSSLEFFERLEQNCRDVPVQSGELYFELHRGTYTSLAANKRDNRRCEVALREVELLGAIAHRAARAAYPSEALERLWKVVLLNQFHDILPGSSIREVYEDSARDYAATLAELSDLREQVIREALKGARAVCVNTLGWARSGVAELPEGIDLGADAAQRSAGGRALAMLRAPSMGAAPIQRIEVGENAARARSVRGGVILENGVVRAEFLKSGVLARLTDLQTGCDLVTAEAPGNQFVLFDDRPNNWEAWDVDIHHLETRQAIGPARALKVVESGPLRAVAEIEFVFGGSRITQKVALEAGSKVLEFGCEVDWQERRTLLKVEFPAAVRAAEASYEIQFGLVRRPTHFNTAQDMARFEVSGHRWMDLSEPGRGLAVFTDSKYGYAVHGSVMRVSLLRGTEDPCPGADRGTHTFRIGLYPHGGDLVAGEVVRRAQEFNVPWRFGQGPETDVSWFEVDTPHLIVDTVKKAEDHGGVIVRLYECHGARGEAVLRSGLPFKRAMKVNLLEERGEAVAVETSAVRLTFRPFEIITLSLS